MNRAAEQAVPAGKDLLVNAVRTMSVADAKGILVGGDTSVTQFFADKTRAPLTERFLPVVTSATVKVKLAEKYNHFAGKMALYQATVLGEPSSPDARSIFFEGLRLP
jgi:hypothetical protein